MNRRQFLCSSALVAVGRKGIISAVEVTDANTRPIIDTHQHLWDLRRFRLGLAGRVRFWPGWNYKVEIDLTDNENTLSDAYLSWRSDRWVTFRIGNQKVAQTLSGQTSSLSISFMERP